MSRSQMSLRARGAAFAYGILHDHVVGRFAPYQSLMSIVTGYVVRAACSDTASADAAPPKVLDVSCGTGTLARRLAEHGCHVVGIDPVESLVERARQRTPETARDLLTFAHRDVATEGPPANDFDVVVSLHTLYWHTRPHTVLDACLHALKPGGMAIIVTYARATTVVADFRAIRRREGMTTAARALGWLVPTVLFERLRNYDYHYFDRELLGDAIEAAGFEVIENRPALFDGLSNLVLAQAPESFPHAAEASTQAPTTASHAPIISSHAPDTASVARAPAPSIEERGTASPPADAAIERRAAPAPAGFALVTAEEAR